MCVCVCVCVGVFFFIFLSPVVALRYLSTRRSCVSFRPGGACCYAALPIGRFPYTASIPSPIFTPHPPPPSKVQQKLELERLIVRQFICDSFVSLSIALTHRLFPSLFFLFSLFFGKKKRKHSSRLRAKAHGVAFIFHQNVSRWRVCVCVCVCLSMWVCWKEEEGENGKGHRVCLGRFAPCSPHTQTHIHIQAHFPPPSHPPPFGRKNRAETTVGGGWEDRLGVEKKVCFQT